MASNPRTSLLYSCQEMSAVTGDSPSLVDQALDEAALEVLGMAGTAADQPQSTAASPPVQSLLDALGGVIDAPPPFLTFGCPILDKFFGGGLLNQGIIEISGAAGCGKTQLCLQLLLTVQLPRKYGGFDGQSVYISTEGPAPSKRLRQIAGGICSRFPDVSGEQLIDNVFVQRISGVDKLLSVLVTEIPKLLRTTGGQGVKLIVIDSIAALFRHEFDKDEAAQRSALLFRLAQEMRRLSSRYDLPIVVTNQVSAAGFDGDADRALMDRVFGRQQAGAGAQVPAAFSLPQMAGSTNAGAGTENNTKPILGLAWASCLTQRVFLTRTGGAPTRRLRIKWSPHVNRLPNELLTYTIDANGVPGGDA